MVKIIFLEDAKAIHWEKDNLFKLCWDNWIYMFRKWKLNPYLTLYTKINS